MILLLLMLISPHAQSFFSFKLVGLSWWSVVVESPWWLESRDCELTLICCIIKGTGPVARHVTKDPASDNRQMTQQELNTHRMTPDYWIKAQVILCSGSVL